MLFAGLLTPMLSAPAAAQSRFAQQTGQSVPDVVGLQPYRSVQSVTIESAGRPGGTASLIDLNPGVGRWFVLSVRTASGQQDFHLESAANPTAMIALTVPRLEVTGQGSTLALVDRRGRCELWSEVSRELLEARRSGLPYAPLCGGWWYLRNAVAGTYTPIERVTEFLRDYVWGGDHIVNFVREEAFGDVYAEHAKSESGTRSASPPDALGPAPALLSSGGGSLPIEVPNLGLDLGTDSAALLMGSWYPVRDASGLFFSVVRPAALPDSILNSDRRHVNRLDEIEANALDYLMAMDLGQFELHFAVGTDEPRVGWSDRAQPQWRSVDRPGPDGFDRITPLVRNGMVNPSVASQVAVTFAGGFKREHGAFKYGALAARNFGSHYGFMQQGVMLSRLQPGLATFYSTIDGAVGMQTWRNEDDLSLLPRLVDARQNGVPLIDYDPVSGTSAPGELVNQWGAGNWSGSSERQLRTLRAGACLQPAAAGRTYLIFGYFSTATPSAMTRVFQAYRCRYAMQLDINALEHTYFALYTHSNGRVVVEHLIDGMVAVDRKGGDQLAPRFIGFPDDRDFFYLVRRQPP